MLYFHANCANGPKAVPFQYQYGIGDKGFGELARRVNVAAGFGCRRFIFLLAGGYSQNELPEGFKDHQPPLALLARPKDIRETLLSTLRANGSRAYFYCGSPRAAMPPRDPWLGWRADFAALRKLLAPFGVAWDAVVDKQHPLDVYAVEPGDMLEGFPDESLHVSDQWATHRRIFTDYHARLVRAGKRKVAPWLRGGVVHMIDTPLGDTLDAPTADKIDWSFDGQLRWLAEAVVFDRSQGWDSSVPMDFFVSNKCNVSRIENAVRTLERKAVQ